MHIKVGTLQRNGSTCKAPWIKILPLPVNRDPRLLKPFDHVCFSPVGCKMMSKSAGAKVETRHYSHDDVQSPDFGLQLMFPVVPFLSEWCLISNADSLHCNCRAKSTYRNHQQTSLSPNDFLQNCRLDPKNMPRGRGRKIGKSGTPLLRRKINSSSLEPIPWVVPAGRGIEIVKCRGPGSKAIVWLCKVLGLTRTSTGGF